MILYDFDGFKKLAVEKVITLDCSEKALENSKTFLLCRVVDPKFDRYFYRGRELVYQTLTIQKIWIDASDLTVLPVDDDG